MRLHALHLPDLITKEIVSQEIERKLHWNK